MKIESAILLINKLVRDQRYGRARELVQQEWDRLVESKNFQQLNEEAKQFVKVIRDEKDTSDLFTLSNTEKKILNLLNQMIRDLNLPYAKRLYFTHKEWIQKPTAQSWLTSDTRFICEAWDKCN